MAVWASLELERDKPGKRSNTIQNKSAESLGQVQNKCRNNPDKSKKTLEHVQRKSGTSLQIVEKPSDKVWESLHKV